MKRHAWVGGKMVCKHCRRTVSRQARGICQRCKKDPEVFARYPASHQHKPGAICPVTAGKGEPEPTEYKPGTFGKLAELVLRASMGLPLYAAGDAVPDLS